jgi:hypothetical protein
MAPSQTDWDQSGTDRRTTRQYLGPSIGFVNAPAPASVFPITAAGTYTIAFGTTLVTVNVAGAVTVILPPATLPGIPAIGAPSRFTQSPITIVDIGGFAQLNPITIQPASGAGENIAGLASISLSVNYGGFSLNPNSMLKGWNVIAP